MNFKEFQNLKMRHSQEEFERILLAVEQDLKFNNLEFKKPISKEKFLSVINTTEKVFRRLTW